MIFRLLWRTIKTVSFKCLWKILINLCFKGILRVKKFEKEKKKSSRFFPAFMMISLTSRCNYSCQGCWVKTKNDTSLPLETVQNIITQSKKHGSAYFGLLGGEPFLYEELNQIFFDNQDCYFQVFTNGSFITKEKARELKKAGNVTPLISIEGLQEVSDKRRQGKDVYQHSTKGIKNCLDAGLFTGVATSICQSNFDELVNPLFLENIIKQGVHYIWYYIYRPVGPNPCPELALSKQQILKFRQFLVDMRLKYPIAIIDTYWDAEGNALCPGAMGLSHHISPAGDLEFCPPIQFSKDKLNDGNDLPEKLINSHFLEQLRLNTAQKTRGCIFMEDPEALCNFMEKENAFDSSLRENVYKEFKNMHPCVSHHLPGEEIPEKSIFYRLAKRYWFFGFGAYA